MISITQVQLVAHMDKKQIQYKKYIQSQALSHQDDHRGLQYFQARFFLFVKGINQIAKPSCEENQQLTKQLIKTEEIGFGIVSACEFIIFNTAVTEYKSVYVPVILSSSLICVLIIITIITFVQKL
ncbi:Hypothetical_protein [Hexamita inflata]|uniref:Hypothetical_protein n=1 Tax=Hexamita inflata TaxID=28002 RepID=A0AA86NJ81_9EUKA|nr:Hypothetical protein HINF_LOCUS7895 [Hexamita inflata]